MDRARGTVHRTKKRSQRNENKEGEKLSKHLGRGTRRKSRRQKLRARIRPLIMLQQTCELVGIRKTRRASMQPQSDGVVERLNAALETN